MQNYWFENLKGHIGHKIKLEKWYEDVTGEIDNIEVVCDNCMEILIVVEKYDEIFETIKNHVGHDIECVGYFNEDELVNVSIECVDCYEVLFSYDKYEEN